MTPFFDPALDKTYTYLKPIEPVDEARTKELMRPVKPAPTPTRRSSRRRRPRARSSRSLSSASTTRGSTRRAMREAATAQPWSRCGERAPLLAGRGMAEQARLGKPGCEHDRGRVNALIECFGARPASSFPKPPPRAAGYRRFIPSVHWCCRPAAARRARCAAATVFPYYGQFVPFNDRNVSMQSSNRLLDDLAKVASGAASAVAGVREEVEGLVRQRVERLVADLDLVSRDEFDVAKAMAAKARAEQEKLEQRVKALEAALARMDAAGGAAAGRGHGRAGCNGRRRTGRRRAVVGAAANRGCGLSTGITEGGADAALRSLHGFATLDLCRGPVLATSSRRGPPVQPLRWWRQGRPPGPARG